MVYSTYKSGDLGDGLFLFDPHKKTGIDANTWWSVMVS